MTISIGEVTAIYIKHIKEEPNRFIEEGFFEKDMGLVGDIHSSKGSKEVSIFTAGGWDEILLSYTEGLCINRFHENIRIKNLELYRLKVGHNIKIGESVQEVTQIGKRCFPECEIVKKGKTCPLSKQVIFTRVLESGRVRIGDEIFLI